MGRSDEFTAIHQRRHMDNVTVEQWKQLFAEIGLTEEKMVAWHRLFEKKFPKGHQGFLEWLGLDPATIARIRKN